MQFVADISRGEWRMPAGDYGNLRYSTLDAIDTTTVKNLRVSTTFSTGIPHGHEGQPLVVNNTMYVVTPFPNNLIAIDLTKPGGALKWIYVPHPDRRAVGIACCDVVNRGAQYADGKIIYSLLDAHVVAVDAEAGTEIWRTTVGNIDVGETMTGALLVVKDKVIVGNSGAELGVRGYVAALDLATGRELWRAYNTGPDADVKIGPEFKAFYQKDQGKDLVGDHGGGGIGPSLRDVDWLHGGADAQVFDSIAHGRSNGMPSWGTKLNQDQIWKLVAYIKSVRTPNEISPPS